MDSKSLMIGDWVYDAILKCNTQVEMLSLSGIRGDCNENIWNEKTFEPIPLTAEILEKNGFRDSFAINEKIFGCEDFEIWIDFKEQGYWVCIKNKVSDHYFEGNKRYVHELQHALRLCGIDKEIVL